MFMDQQLWPSCDTKAWVSYWRRKGQQGPFDTGNNVLGRKTVDWIHIVVTHVSTLGSNVLRGHGEWELGAHCG